MNCSFCLLGTYHAKFSIPVWAIPTFIRSTLNVIWERPRTASSENLLISSCFRVSPYSISNPHLSWRTGLHYWTDLLYYLQRKYDSFCRISSRANPCNTVCTTIHDKSDHVWKLRQTACHLAPSLEIREPNKHVHDVRNNLPKRNGDQIWLPPRVFIRSNTATSPTA